MFNAGIYMTSTQYWIKYSILDQIKSLMTQYKSGTQLFLNIVFHSFYTKSTEKWNFPVSRAEYLKTFENLSVDLHHYSNE